MSALSVTAANVLPGANAIKRTGIAGATITAGQAVYEDSADGKFKLADADLSAAASKVVGIALHGASNGQQLTIDMEDDDFTPGATLSLSAAGDTGVYVLDGTAGGICPFDDLAAGDYPVILYVAKSTTKCKLKIINGGTVLAS